MLCSRGTQLTGLAVPLLLGCLASLRSPFNPSPSCSDLLLSQLWAALPAAERSAVLASLATAEGREKLPAVKSHATQLAAKLRQLA